MDQQSTPVIELPDNEKPPSGWRELFSTIGILLTALAVALFIITFIFRSYQVDGPSMETTLQNADKLIIWKVPRSWARLTGHSHIPQRGDIIVFEQSGLNEYGSQDNKQLIKRVVGLPGERVVITNNTLTVYNRTNPQGFSPDATLPYGKVINDTSGNSDVRLAKDELFVAGDNRADSLDSRTFGPIKADQVVGELVMRVFPIGQARTF